MRRDAEALIGGPEDHRQLLRKKTKMGFDGETRGLAGKRSGPFEDAINFAVLAADERTLELDGHAQAGLVPPPCGFGATRFGEERIMQNFQKSGEFVERKEQRGMLADDLGLRVAVQPLRRGVPEQDRSIELEADDRLLAIREQNLKN